MRTKAAHFRLVGWVAIACWVMMLTSSQRADALPARATPVVSLPEETASVSLADPALRGKIEPALFKQLVIANAGETLPVVAEMLAQADLSSAAAHLPDRIAAGTSVVESLRATADSSQSGVRTFLAAEESAGRANSVRPLWIVNAVAVHAAPQTITQLAARPDVALVRADRWAQRIETNDKSQISNLKSQISPLSAFWPLTSDFQLPTSSVEWGVSKIRADEVWAAFGITGTGVVVANMDTGVDWLHPALASTLLVGLTRRMAAHSIRRMATAMARIRWAPWQGRGVLASRRVRDGSLRAF
jgi:hypothetical protein